MLLGGVLSITAAIGCLLCSTGSGSAYLGGSGFLNGIGLDPSERIELVKL